MYGQSVRLPLGRGLNGRGFDDDDDDDGKTYGEVRRQWGGGGGRLLYINLYMSRVK